MTTLYEWAELKKMEQELFGIIQQLKASDNYISARGDLKDLHNKLSRFIEAAKLTIDGCSCGSCMSHKKNGV